MGDSPQSFLDFLKNKARKQRRNWIKGGKLMIKKNRSRSRRISMRRRALLEASRRTESGVERKVRTLKKLVPNSDESMGLDGLFRETADYILSLQMRVKVMQVMVDVLAGDSDIDLS